MPRHESLSEMQIVGLEQFRRDVRRLGPEYRKAWDRTLRPIGRPIVRKARKRYRQHHPRGIRRRRARGQGRPRPSRGSQRGIRAGYRRGTPFVMINDDRYPWLLGQEWGTTGGKRDSLGRPLNRFPPRRHKKGYFFWMTAVEGMGEAMKKIIRAVDRANGRVFKDTGGF